MTFLIVDRRTTFPSTPACRDSSGYFKPGRIILEHANQYELATEFGDCPSMLTGKMRFIGESEGAWPAVGDWVVITYLADENKALIHDVLPRRTKFSRKVAVRWASNSSHSTFLLCRSTTCRSS